MPISDTLLDQKYQARTPAKLKAAATAHRALLEASPERVKTYFQDPRVTYAAGKLHRAGSIMWSVSCNSVAKTPYHNESR